MFSFVGFKAPSILIGLNDFYETHYVISLADIFIRYKFLANENWTYIN